LVNLLIPADVVPRLRIPDLAVTTGEPGVFWCDRPWGRFRWSRRHVVRLPYDAVSAGKLRKRARLDRLHRVFLVAYLVPAVLVLFDVRPDLAGWGFAASAVMVAVSLLDAHWDAAPKPSRTGRGDLYLPGLPPAVAQRWIEANPGVRQVDRMPTYRRYRPRVYVTAAVTCALAAGAIVVLLFDGADFPLLLLYVPPILAGSALVLAYRALPTGHLRLNGDDS
jgi:hypothetical protein